VEADRRPGATTQALVVDDAVSAIAEVRGVLVTVAANEAREKGPG
jgi:hypothetical protein